MLERCIHRLRTELMEFSLLSVASRPDVPGHAGPFLRSGAALWVKTAVTLSRKRALHLESSIDTGMTFTSINDTEIKLAGSRRQGGFPSAASPTTADYQLYFPFVGQSTTLLEFWLVDRDPPFGDCRLYRSLDYGATWELMVLP